MNNSVNSIIAELNDKFRCSGDQSLGKFVMTDTISSLPPEKQIELLHLVQTFNQFNAKNDPWKEHDFGKIVLDDLQYVFKIDYFDPTLTRHSDDAANPKVTKRVLTLMLADEY